jgi:2-amino-4-hydroxy-6-hydroxymethyldihydropteridine diphosphokinase
MLALRLRRAVFGIGSNLGDRVSYVQLAVANLRALDGVHGAVRSQLYETVPVGGPAQGDYINAALLVHTARSPRSLLEAALEIELRHGRVRGVRNGPRTLDIDLLWVEGEAVDEPALTVPHPRLVLRAFALIPLLEVASDARDPVSGRPLASWAADLDLRGIRRTNGAMVAPWALEGPECGPLV